MITALVLAERGVDALAATLAALVPAVAEGLVGDAVVLVRAPDPEVANVAEAVGASLAVVPDGAGIWQAGAALARRDWLLCLEAGDVPVEDWARAVERFLAFDGGRRPLARFRRRPQALGLRMAHFWEGRVGVRQARAGDLVQRRFLVEGKRQRPARLSATLERDAAFR
jgi:F0F1-type ATP synthase membrane subunit c/vacuolar-type H+-ATPase subunit K